MNDLRGTARSLTAPVTALVGPILIALALAPVTFGPLFYANYEPQNIANPGGLTGAAIFFLVIPSIVWLGARLGSRDTATS